MKNPVLWLELRIRIRERKLWIVTCLYLFCLFAISCIAITTAANEGVNEDPAVTGLTIFGFGIFSLLGLLVILGPLASAGVISQEREQRTLPALLNTPLSPTVIVIGKLLAAWAFILWLAVLSLPFLGLGVVWGAVAPGRMLGGLGLAIAAGLVSSTIAVGLSGYFRRSLTSYLATGAVMFLWLIVWPILGALMMNLLRSTGGGDTPMDHPFIFYGFFYHHPVAPLVYLMIAETEKNVPSSIIPFALGIWVLIGVLFFALARRGLQR
jgi:ABC-type transport system involved in multi-copper enzyme maturation permease subunit